MDARKLKHIIEQLKDRDTIKNVYALLKNDINFKPTINNNGLYFDINSLDETTLININEIINKAVVDDDKPMKKLVYKPNKYNMVTDDSIIKSHLLKNMLKLNLVV